MSIRLSKIALRASIEEIPKREKLQNREGGFFHSFKPRRSGHPEGQNRLKRWATQVFSQLQPTRAGAPPPQLQDRSKAGPPARQSFHRSEHKEHREGIRG